MAAVAMKMDELLVSWLGSDAMYENILNLIESNKLQQSPSPAAASKSGNSSIGTTSTAATTLSNDDINSNISSDTSSDKNNDQGSNSDNISAGGAGSSAKYNNKKDSDDFSVTSIGSLSVSTTASSVVGGKIVIPPFYPPLSQTKKDDDDNSTNRAAILRRRRRSPVLQNETWLPLPQAELMNKSDNNAASDGKRQDINNNNNAAGGAAAEATSSRSLSAEESQLSLRSSEQLQGAGPGGPGQQTGVINLASSSLHDHESKICVRDQVRAVYAELGHDPPLTSPTSIESLELNSSNDAMMNTTNINDPPSLSATHNRNNNNTHIFFYNNNNSNAGAAGSVGSNSNNQDVIEALNKKYITQDSFVRITKEVCKFPSFFNNVLYQRILDMWNKHHTNAHSISDANGNDKVELNVEVDVNSELPINVETNVDVITLEMFEWYWLQEMEPYDAQDRFFRLTKQIENDYIVRDDFLPYIKALLNDHPGLEFLSNHSEFQEKYAVTVITRIFYCVNKCHSGRITSRQIRRSDLLDAFHLVDEEEDINKVTRYFSYEHFYVLYCRFWELDHDRDYRITREDLLKYGDHSLSHMIVDRIFDAAPRPFINYNNNNDIIKDNNTNDIKKNPNSSPNPINREYLSYEDFIYFMLSEEDKSNEVSVRYWFTCVDVDGDGRLNNMEMRSFYAVQLHRMQLMGHEIVPFEDMLCQMMDMIKPNNTDYLIAEDFLQSECKSVSGALYDALFNLNKYLLFEQRDPFVERQKREDEFETDWDRFACIDYNRLAMEEEAREEEAMEIDWVTVDDSDDSDNDINLTMAGQNNNMNNMAQNNMNNQGLGMMQQQQQDQHHQVVTNGPGGNMSGIEYTYGGGHHQMGGSSGVVVTSANEHINHGGQQGGGQGGMGSAASEAPF